MSDSTVAVISYGPYTRAVEKDDIGSCEFMQNLVESVGLSWTDRQRIVGDNFHVDDGEKENRLQFTRVLRDDKRYADVAEHL